GGKVDGLRVTSVAPVPRDQPPKPVDDERIVARVPQLAEEGVGVLIEHVDPPISKVADEQIAREGAERRGRDRQSPGGVERTRRSDSGEEAALQIEGTDEAVSSARYVVFLRRVLQRVGDVKL